jgi:hypothetical protein
VPLRVYEAPRFFVEALVWKDGELAIHDHGFGGAFAVLSGSSIHVTYEFAPDAMLNAGFGVGTLGFEAAEYLRAGDVRAIEAGRRFVHAVYHVASPTVSLVVRSRLDFHALPQLTYAAPGVALDRSALARDAYAKPLAALRVAADVDPELHRQLALETVRTRDALLAYQALSRAARGPLFQQPDQLSELRDATARAHPALASHLAPSLAAQVRLLDLVNRRRKATQPELRLFYALLLNVPRRKPLLDLVAAIQGTDPVDTVVAWLERAAPQLPAPLDAARLGWLRRRLAGADADPSPLGEHLDRILAPLVDGFPVT